ncbi:MAG: DUF4268 domain-containing protein [Armatimonadia bacterium]
MKPEKGYHRLRKHRLSVAGETYFITTCCMGREPLLTSSPVLELVKEAIHGMLGRGLARLDGYVIMPDHLHLVFALEPSALLPAVMMRFKTYTSLRANRLLGRRGPFWQDGYYDHMTRSETDWCARMEYMLLNPVRAGLAKSPEEYPWARTGPWWQDQSGPAIEAKGRKPLVLGHERLEPRRGGSNRVNHYRAEECERMTASEQLWLEYWTDFARRAKASDVVSSHKPGAAYWYRSPVGRSGFNLYAAARIHERKIGVALEIRGRNRLECFRQLQARKQSVERELGASLEWRELADRRISRILLHKVDVDVRDRGQWPEQHRWLLEHLSAFHAVFSPLVRHLNADLR